MTDQRTETSSRELINVVLIHPGFEIGRRYADGLEVDHRRLRLIWIPDLRQFERLTDPVDLVLLDAVTAGEISIFTLREIKRRIRGKLVVLSRTPRLAEAVVFVRNGADDYQGYPAAGKAFHASIMLWTNSSLSQS